MERAFGKDAFRCRVAPDAARRLFGWPQLNTTLAGHRLAPPRFRLERAGGDDTKGVLKTRRTRRGELLHDLDPAALTERLRAGATLILDCVNEISPPLRDLCAGLAAEFSASVQANLYACWGTTQGFDVHWDDHDVLVVQVEGTKRWALYGQTREAPMRRDLHAEHVRPETPIAEIELAPGDVLYLPRGYWHAAVGLGGPTLHLTIGLTRKTGADFLTWLADHMVSDPLARRDLAFEDGEAAVAEQLQALLAEVAAQDPGRLARAYARHVAANQLYRPALAFPDIGEAGDFSDDAAFRLADGVARLREKPPQEVVLSWRGVELTLDAALTAPLRRLVARETLTTDEIAAALPADKRGKLGALLRDLLQRGVLRRGDGA